MKLKLKDKWERLIPDPHSRAGQITHYASAVPEGEMWVLLGASGVDCTSALPWICLSKKPPPDGFHVAVKVDCAPFESLDWNGEYPLEAGERISMVYEGVNEGDYVETSFWGWKYLVKGDDDA